MDEKSLQKKAFQSANAFEFFNNTLNQIFIALIDVIDITSDVLEGVGDTIPGIGFVFLLLAEALRTISTALNPKTTSTPIKILALLAIPAVVALITVGIISGPVTMKAMAIAALTIGAIRKELKFLDHLMDYFSFSKERDIQDDFQKIIQKKDITNEDIKTLEDKIGKEKLIEKLKIRQHQNQNDFEKALSSNNKVEAARLTVIQGKIGLILNKLGDTKNNFSTQKLAELEQLYQERNATIKDYTTNMTLFSLSKTQRKTLADIDRKIEAITKPDEYIQRELTNAKKNAVNTAGDFLLVAGCLGIAIASLSLIVASAPVSVPLLAIGITIGTVGCLKLFANKIIEHQDKKAEKTRKHEKKIDLQEEVLKTYQHQNQNQLTSNCNKIHDIPPAPLTPTTDIHHDKNQETKTPAAPAAMAR